MRSIHLLATDLDGTLIGSAQEFPLYSSFREKLNELRQDCGLIWVACTGRPLRSFKGFFSPMRAMGIAPDFVVVNHAYIFERTRAGYIPHIFWNLRIAYIIWLNKITARGLISDWHDMITRVSGGIATLRRSPDRLLLRFDNEESAITALELLKEEIKEYRHLQIFRSGQDLDVRAVPFTKGLAVLELSRHLEIDKKDIFAIGNGHNDISMLDKKVAGMIACPSNSESEVMEVVSKAGGHVSSLRALAGVMDSIEAYLNDAVSSELPENWIPPVRKTSEYVQRSSKKKKRGWTWQQKILAALIAYVVLLVFANFGLIPFVSRYIMIPYQMALKVLTKLLMSFWA